MDRCQVTDTSSDSLLKPGRIGPATIPNRIVMPAMTTRNADAEGFVTDDVIAYYRARAEGGVGLITVEMASPERAGRHRRHKLGIFKDEVVPGLTRLVDEIHRWGAKASIQLGHGGGHTRVDICGEQPIAPSAIPHPVQEITFEIIVPEAMTEARIRQTVAAFGAAARRAEQAGFDCVEIRIADEDEIGAQSTFVERIREFGYADAEAADHRIAIGPFERKNDDVFNRTHCVAR